MHSKFPYSHLALHLANYSDEYYWPVFTIKLPCWNSNCFCVLLTGCRDCTSSTFVWFSLLHAGKFVKPWRPGSQLCWGLCQVSILWKFHAHLFIQLVEKCNLVCSIINLPFSLLVACRKCWNTVREAWEFADFNCEKLSYVGNSWPMHKCYKYWILKSLGSSPCSFGSIRCWTQHQVSKQAFLLITITRLKNSRI